MNTRRLAGFSKLDGVADQVLKDLNQLGAVDINFGKLVICNLRAGFGNHSLKV